MDFFRNCFHLGKIGVQVLLDVNVAGHPVSSAASLDLLGGRLRGRAARQISSEFFAGWRSSAAENGRWRSLFPDVADGLYKFAPPERLEMK